MGMAEVMKRIVTAVIFSLSTVHSVFADGVGINALRVIYPEKSESVSTSLRNTTKDTDYLTRVKVTSGVEGGDSPFSVVPPVFRMRANSKNDIRIIKTGGNLPTDRESLFWLNMQSIPMVSDLQRSDGKVASAVQIGLGNTIKLIYRPDGLPVTPDKGFCMLQFSLASGGLKITNLSPYYVSFSSFKVNGTQMMSNTQSTKMVEPLSEKVMHMKAPNTPGLIEWQAITDLGGTVDCKGRLQ